MAAVLIFAAALVAASLVSELAARSILSTSVLFLVAGFVLGPGMAGALRVGDDLGTLAVLAELTLFAVLFTDGMQVSLGDLRRAWHLPGRALLVGMPVTIALNAAAARGIAGLSWRDALLVGAALSPTDPVFAAALVGHRDVPARLKGLLNVESGLNDGLALPVVLALLASARPGGAGGGGLALELAAGIALGIAVPAIVVRMERLRVFSAAEDWRPLLAFAIGLVVLSGARLSGANEFLAAFAAGATVATVGPRLRDAFRRFGLLVAELLKLASLLLLGSLLTPELLASTPLRGYLFAAAVLFAVRPVALAVAIPPLRAARLPWREWATAAWFGPKGFASVTYGMLILTAGIPEGRELARLIGVTVAASVVLHSSTDVLVARWFRPAPEPARA